MRQITTFITKNSTICDENCVFLFSLTSSGQNYTLNFVNATSKHENRPTSQNTLLSNCFPTNFNNAKNSAKKSGRNILLTLRPFFRQRAELSAVHDDVKANRGKIESWEEELFSLHHEGQHFSPAFFLTFFMTFLRSNAPHIWVIDFFCFGKHVFRASFCFFSLWRDNKEKKIMCAASGKLFWELFRDHFVHLLPIMAFSNTLTLRKKAILLNSASFVLLRPSCRITWAWRIKNK